MSNQDINGWIMSGKRPHDSKLAAIARHFRIPYPALLALIDPNVREAVPRYVGGSPSEPVEVHSVPVRGAISPSGGGAWMDSRTGEASIRGRVRWIASAPDLYAYQVLGDELSPRIHAGEFIVVDPSQPCESGDEILVEMRDGRFAVLMLVKRSGGALSCRQVGSISRAVTISEQDVAAMHVITGTIRQHHWIPDTP